jgi:hypothetical protein
VTSDLPVSGMNSNTKRLHKGFHNCFLLIVLTFGWLSLVITLWPIKLVAEVNTAARNDDAIGFRFK